MNNDLYQAAILKGNSVLYNHIKHYALDFGAYCDVNFCFPRFV